MAPGQWVSRTVKGSGRRALTSEDGARDCAIVAVVVLDAGEHGVGRGVAPDVRGLVLAEAHGVAPGDPANGHEAHGDVVLHDHGKHVLLTNEATVEEGEAGGHQVDEPAAHEHPRGVTGVDIKFSGD